MALMWWTIAAGIAVKNRVIRNHRTGLRPVSFAQRAMRKQVTTYVVPSAAMRTH